MHKIAGSSAGALVATAHICGNLQLAYATTDILRVAIDARARALGPFHPSFDINAVVRDALERGLPDDVHHRVSGKLHISLTRVYDGENVIISSFESKEDVIQALICSCFIPFWSGLIAPKYKGITYIDGGFSNNLLILDDKTVTVSPFAGEADICPQDDVYNLLTINLSNTSFSITPHNLYRLSQALLPPQPEMLSELCQRGFADGIRFLQRMKLISCTKCLEIRSSLILADATTEIIETTSTYSRRSHYSSDLRSRTNSCSSSAGLNILSSETSSISSMGYGINFISMTDDEEDDNCDGCITRRKNALRDPLPKLFSDRIREACDTVNKSFYNWFYSHRPIKYLSYLAAPYYLPVNISLALFLKFWQQIPSIGGELLRSVYDLKDFLLDVARKILEGTTTTSMLMSTEETESNQNQKQSKAESSISVKITADCRSSSESCSARSLTTYELCLTVVLFGRQTLLSIHK